MKVIDNQIGKNGYKCVYLMLLNRLSRILVNNGFGDLKVKVGESEITCVRSILMNGNAILRKLLLDEKMGEVLELYEKCEINSFLEIEKYYSGGCMELNENNVCDILRFSVYYNDNRIMRICKKYLKNHLTQSIMAEIFSMLDGLNIKSLNDLRDVCENYIKLNGLKYLNEDSLLLKMNLNSLKMILNNQKLIIKNESWLLNRLMLWYEKVLKVKENDEDYEEELISFISIIKTKIHLNEIRKEEIKEDVILELKSLNIPIDEYMNNHINLNMDDIHNESLMRIIQKNYIKEDEDGLIELNEKEKEELNDEKVKEEMIRLLYKEDLKLIEIVLNIIIEMKMYEIIPEEIKNKLLRDLLSEYGRNPKNLTLKCLCLLVDSKDNIHIIEILCGKGTLYRILNNEYYLNSKSKELIIEYIQEMKMNKKEEEEMRRIIKNEEILEELLIKKLTLFEYPQLEYSFLLNEEILIKPSFDGTGCVFSISPSLPSGIKINKESGIIHGKVKREIEKKEYEISCKNVRNEKKFKIVLEFVDINFTELNKSDGLTISKNGKLITNKDGYNTHCYLNLKIESGIYHIKYQFNYYSFIDCIMLGLSTNNTYSDDKIRNQSTICNYVAYDDKSQDITNFCHIGRVVNRNPNFNNHGDGSIYEIIVDMNKREFWISHNDSSPVLLVKDLPSPLYPYVEIDEDGSSIELLSVFHHN